MSSKGVQALMKQADELYRINLESVQLRQNDPEVAFFGAYLALRQAIKDHFDELEMRFSDNPARHGWRWSGTAEEPEIIFSVRVGKAKAEMPCPVSKLAAWGFLPRIVEKLMSDYRADVVRQLKDFNEASQPEELRSRVSEMFTLMKWGCVEIVPVLYEPPASQYGAFKVRPDLSMMRPDHWATKGAFTIVFSGFAAKSLIDPSFGGNGTLKSWVIAMRPFK